MANSFLQLLGFVLSLVGTIMTICICVFPEWKVNDTQGEVIESIRRSHGLWISCMTMSSGHWQCDEHDQFFLGLPAPLQTARACVCLSLAFQAISLLVSLAGLECTNLISTYPEDDPEEINKNMKSKMMLGVGALNVFVGVLLAIGVSYFAATVLEEFNSYEVQQMAGRAGKYGNVPSQTSTIGRYIYGQCLFIGWAAMVVHIVAGSVLICSSCGNASVGASSSSYFGGGNTMQNRLIQNRGGTAPISNEFQMPQKNDYSAPQNYI